MGSFVLGHFACVLSRWVWGWDWFLGSCCFSFDEMRVIPDMYEMKYFYRAVLDLPSSVPLKRPPRRLCNRSCSLPLASVVSLVTTLGQYDTVGPFHPPVPLLRRIVRYPSCLVLHLVLVRLSIS